MKAIVLENGHRIEMDGDTSYYIGKDGILYVYVPTYYGAGYEPIGKVKETLE